MLDIRTVTIIGVTGTMGANVAGIFASFGNAKVNCIGRDINKVNNSLSRIVKSVKADSIMSNLYPHDYSTIESCIAESDLIFESVVEDKITKAEMARLIGNSMKKTAISCSGTSGLSINEISECYPKELKSRFFGVHFFNPPYSMSLCELVSSDYSDIQLKEELADYLKKRLYRTVVKVKDSPAFLANRIGFQLINEAMQFANKYKDNGGIDYIDAILGPFTGRIMPPLVTSDFVGLDVHKAIVSNIYANTNDYAHDTFLIPEFADKLISEGKMGRKSGCGLYQTIRYDDNYKKKTVFDISSTSYRDVISYTFPFAEAMKIDLSNGDYKEAFMKLICNHSQEAEICLSFLLKYIVYSLFAAKEVANKIDSADDVMATGFNWCPPVAMYNALSEVCDVNELIKIRIPQICNVVDVDSYLHDIKKSKYDYRRYFRTGR